MELRKDPKDSKDSKEPADSAQPQPQAAPKVQIVVIGSEPSEKEVKVAFKKKKKYSSSEVM